jgi:hypothetical protein
LIGIDATQNIEDIAKKIDDILGGLQWLLEKTMKK